MEITRNSFKLLILATIIIPIIEFVFEYTSISTSYDNLEEQLRPGFIFEALSPNIIMFLLITFLLIFLFSLILLYLFKPIGRPLYLVSILLMLFISMFSGDAIEYSILYPLEYFGSFLEVFILYLIYLSPLRNEFDKLDWDKTI